MLIHKKSVRFRQAACRQIGSWLLILAAMVFVMVVLGGATRLTGSGLSMVEWQPLTLLPPLSAADWQTAFDAYRQSPQYRLVNSAMDLAGFQDIFWLEYIHRLWGRLIGAAFLLPFLLFLLQGKVGWRDVPRLLLLFLLGAAQGGVGWLMVQSGLVDRPEVSHLRLAAHLGMALLIFMALLWNGLKFRQEALPTTYFSRTQGEDMLPRLWLVLLLVCVTIPAGALVAGLHAGLVYNSFPLMNGDVIPPEAFTLSPWWLNMIDNHALVQFDHRVLALSVWLASLWTWWKGRDLRLGPALRVAAGLVPLLATVQVGLGIATLLLSVPLPLAVLHQANAFLLAAAAVWAMAEASR